MWKEPLVFSKTATPATAKTLKKYATKSMAFVCLVVLIGMFLRTAVHVSVQVYLVLIIYSLYMKMGSLCSDILTYLSMSRHVCLGV